MHGARELLLIGNLLGMGDEVKSYLLSRPCCGLGDDFEDMIRMAEESARGGDFDGFIKVAEEFAKMSEDERASLDLKVRSLDRAVDVLNRVVTMAPEGSWAKKYGYMLRDSVSKRRRELKKEMKTVPPPTVTGQEGVVFHVLKSLKWSVDRWKSGAPVSTFQDFKKLLPAIMKTRREEMEEGGYTEGEISRSILRKAVLEKVSASASMKELEKEFGEGSQVLDDLRKLRQSADLRLILEKKKTAEKLIRELATVDSGKANYMWYLMTQIMEKMSEG